MIKSNSFEKQCLMYLINLDDRTDRLHDMKQKLEQSGFDGGSIVRFSGIPGRNLTRSYLESILSTQALDDIDSNVRKRHGQLTYGAVGCALSHAQIWQQLVDEPNDEIQYALVFEDDIRIPKLFRKFMNQVMDTIISKGSEIDWDLFLFSSFCPPSLTSIKCTDEKHVLDHMPVKIVRFNMFWSLACYVISRKGAKKLLMGMLPMEDQLDTYISKRILRQAISVIGTSPSVINQERIQYGSNIQTRCVNCDVNKEFHVV